MGQPAWLDRFLTRIDDIIKKHATALHHHHKKFSLPPNAEKMGKNDLLILILSHNSVCLSFSGNHLSKE